MAVGQNLVPLVNIKIAGKWMFIPLKMVLIGIDPYPYPFSSMLFPAINLHLQKMWIPLILNIPTISPRNLPTIVDIPQFTLHFPTIVHVIPCEWLMGWEFPHHCHMDIPHVPTISGWVKHPQPISLATLARGRSSTRGRPMGFGVPGWLNLEICGVARSSLRVKKNWG